MPAETRGSLYKVRSGWGIRWPENGERQHESPFATKTEARRWFIETVLPRLQGHATPVSPEISYDAFCDLFLTRHVATAAKRTVEALRYGLGFSRAMFGDWTLRELEGAVDDIVAWRTTMPEKRRFVAMAAFRQVLIAANRWGYMTKNPAVRAGKNPRPRREEFHPFERPEVDAIADEIAGDYRSLVIFGAATGFRTNELAAVERRDIDRANRAVTVQRSYSARSGLVPYPKTARSRRRVPLTQRALDAIETLVPRIDTPLLFTAPEGGYLNLDHWRSRFWYPALAAAGVEQRGPYHLRHTFASEALAAGVPVFELARLMGTSVAMIDRTYGHLVKDSEERLRGLLDSRERTAGQRDGVELASDDDPE